VLRPDRTRLKATRDDLSYVVVQVVDVAGRLVPDAVTPVNFRAFLIHMLSFRVR
jgi:beta-galactosidase